MSEEKPGEQPPEPVQPAPAGAPVAETAAPANAESANQELAKAQAEAAEFKDKYLRALAEIENSRRRLQRDKLESQSFAIQNVLVDFLQPIDHFEVALKHSENASGEVKHWALGFEMILSQMKQVLADHGIEPFDSKGAQFDPHMHEAIETQESELVPAGTILEEFVRGYKMGNRVVRPAKVKVAIQKAASQEEKTS